MMDYETTLKWAEAKWGKDNFIVFLSLPELIADITRQEAERSGGIADEFPVNGSTILPVRPCGTSGRAGGY